MINHANTRFQGLEHEPHSIDVNTAAPTDTLARLYGAGEYIRAHRFPKYGPLDIAMTAAGLDLEVVTHSTEEWGVHGFLRSDERQISIRDDLSEAEQLVTFAHETGHYFLSEFLTPARHGIKFSRMEEHLAEYFAHLMIFHGANFDTLDTENEQAMADFAKFYNTSMKYLVYGFMMMGPADMAIVKSRRPDYGDHAKDSGELLEREVCRCCHGLPMNCNTEVEPVLINAANSNLADSFAVSCSEPGRQYQYPLYGAEMTTEDFFDF